MKLAVRMNSLAEMGDAYKNVGFVIMMMTVVMVQMKRIVPRYRVPLMSSPVPMVLAFIRNGNVMEIQIAMMDLMKW